MAKVDYKGLIQTLSFDIYIAVENMTHNEVVFVTEAQLPMGIRLFMQLPELQAYSGNKAPLVIEAASSEQDDNVFRYRARYITLKDIQKEFISSLTVEREKPKPEASKSLGFMFQEKFSFMKLRL